MAPLTTDPDDERIRKPDEAELEEQLWRLRATERARREALQAPSRPRIDLGRDIAPVVDAVMLELKARGGVFTRGGVLVHAVRSERGGIPAVQLLQQERLREIVGEVAVFHNAYGQPVMPPMWVAQTLRARDQWDLPPIEGVTDAPVLRRGGSFFRQDGYDPETRLFVQLAPELAGLARAIPEEPTRAEAQGALQFLLEPFADFPIANDIDRSVILAAILTLPARHLIEGSVPAFLVTATAAGTGKTLLADCIGAIATGAELPRLSPAVDPNEERKRLLALALEGTPVALLDNATGELRSAVLAAALTATSIKDRVLGQSATATAPLRAMFIVTGNNLAIRGDLARRFLQVRLDARCEAPDERSGFRHPQLLKHLKQTRPAYLSAALLALRAYIRRVDAAPVLAPFGSFEGWSDLVRAAITWAGFPDPCASREELRLEADPERESIGQLLAAWYDRFGEETVTAKELLAEPALADALPPGPRGRPADARSLGNALRGYKGRIVGGLRLERTGKDRLGVALWGVRADAGSAGSAGPLSRGDEEGE